MMAERGVDISHTTILRWIQRFVPEFEKRWNRYAELKGSGAMRPEAKVRTSKYLNNLIEQDHRRVKQRTYPTLGFKRFANAVVTISGLELVHKIRKGQFDTTKLSNWIGGRVPHVWEAVLAA